MEPRDLLSLSYDLWALSPYNDSFCLASVFEMTVYLLTYLLTYLDLSGSQCVLSSVLAEVICAVFYV